MKALVIGGTGPSGPHVVEGLLDRGYETTILHTGQHEVEFSRPVEHLHADPHFAEAMAEALGTRAYDVVVFMYGRLRVAAEVLKGHTERLIAVGGAGGYAQARDPRWGPVGRPFGLNEDGVWQDDAEADKFHYLMHLSEERVLEAHGQGAYNATIIRPCTMYGPRQPGPDEWCIVRRVLDRRKRLIIADGGLKVQSRIAAENAASAVLLVLDKPRDSAGKRYNVRDKFLFTERQRIEFVARVLGHELELVDMPYELAKPCHVLWQHRAGHAVIDDSRIRSELGYRDRIPADEALARTVRWLLDHPPRRGGEEELQLGDPFDYDAEDELIRAWEESRVRVQQVPFQLPPPAHRYRHPKVPGDTWARPEGRAVTQR